MLLPALFAVLLLGGKPADAELAAHAGEAAKAGQFESAVTDWKALADQQRRAQDFPGLIDSLNALCATYQTLGRQRLAVAAGLEAKEQAEKLHDRARLIAALNGLGAARTFSHEAAFAEEHLRQALALARREGDRALVASVLNNLAILLAAQGKEEEAMKDYRECAATAAAAGDLALAARARCNLADAALRSGAFAQVPEANRAVLEAARRLPDSHDKALCFLRAGKTWEGLFAQAPEHEQKLRLEALQAYQQAAKISETIGDHRSLAYALGYTGHLYEQEKKWSESLALTRRAAFLAQEERSPESLYQWEWQTARLEKAQGHRDEAIADYRRTLHLLDGIRDDLSSRLGNINAHSSFREAAGAAYFELADLLLQRADHETDADLQSILREARDTCEQLKAVELEDYFQDDCVSLLKAKTRTVENAAAGSAVIYLIPLPDRVEIIVSANGKLERFKSAIGAAQLLETVRLFREHLQTRTTEEYLDEAQKLYTWLIQPIRPALERDKIDTLVFVPDGSLRTIPMAALHDGQKFLVERYAIAVTPGLTLMEPKPIRRDHITMLVDGLTQAVTRDGEQFPALPHVKQEVAGLQKLFGGTALVDQDFRVPKVASELQAQPFSVVHIASHGEFSGDVRKTFVLTYDDRLTLNGLEHLIRPSQLRDQPVELLSLSACQTAAGDDRAALGLAGVAIKAGARSAFATLWCVDDEASTELVQDFYEHLQKSADISKAKALQAAQIKLLGKARTGHPCFWAPYLIIGNWL